MRVSQAKQQQQQQRSIRSDHSNMMRSQHILHESTLPETEEYSVRAAADLLALVALGRPLMMTHRNSTTVLKEEEKEKEKQEEKCFSASPSSSETSFLSAFLPHSSSSSTHHTVSPTDAPCLPCVPINKFTVVVTAEDSCPLLQARTQLAQQRIQRANTLSNRLAPSAQHIDLPSDNKEQLSPNEPFFFDRDGTFHGINSAIQWLFPHTAFNFHSNPSVSTTSPPDASCISVSPVDEIRRPLFRYLSEQ